MKCDIRKPNGSPAVYVDALFYCPSRHPLAYAAGSRYGHLWCHMWADDLEALHLMAERIGMRREWFQNRPGFPHYDLLPPRRAAALMLGAIERSLADWLWEKRLRIVTASPNTLT